MFFNYHVENSQKIHAKVKHIYFHKYKLNVHFVRFKKKKLFETYPESPKRETEECNK